MRVNRNVSGSDLLYCVTIIGAEGERFARNAATILAVKKAISLDRKLSLFFYSSLFFKAVSLVCVCWYFEDNKMPSVHKFHLIFSFPDSRVMNKNVLPPAIVSLAPDNTANTVERLFEDRNPFSLVHTL